MKNKKSPSHINNCKLLQTLKTHRYRTEQLLNNNSFLPSDFKCLLHFPLLSDPQTQADPAGRGVRVSVFRCVSVTEPWERAVPCGAEAAHGPCLLPIFKFSALRGTHSGTSSQPLPAWGAQQAAETQHAKPTVGFICRPQRGARSNKSALQTGSQAHDRS